MKKSDLAADILASVKDSDGAVISDFNKEVLSELEEAEFTGTVDDKAVETAKALLRTFLNDTWPEKPHAHRYVIGSCLALAFLFERPMHPREKVPFISRIEEQKEVFYCPNKEPGTVCDFCPALPMDPLKTMWDDQIEKTRAEFGENAALIRKEILAFGFQEAGVIPVTELAFHEDVRKLCEENQCRCYGTTWACPPAVGSLEECRGRVSSFNYLHLFSKAYVLEDSLDMRGMMNGMKDFKKTARKLDAALRSNQGKRMILTNESCDRCADCTYPSKPCRFPKELQHSIEGYGFYVSELAEQAGIRYGYGAGTVTFFGAFLH